LHTGQHYDDEMSRIFFEELGIPAPDRQLGVGSGSLTSQTARMLEALEPELAALEPDLVLVYGDTNSTLAGALVAAQRQVPVAHVEAGMRSFDRTMPEELNRVLTDHASVAAALLDGDGCGEPDGRGHRWGEVNLVGDVMADPSCSPFAPVAERRSTALEDHGVEPRRLTPGDRAPGRQRRRPCRLNLLVELLEALPLPTVFPLHPQHAQTPRCGGGCSGASSPRRGFG